MAEYTPVTSSDLEAVSSPVFSDAELLTIRRSSRFVVALCFLQLGMALINLLSGGFIMMVISALFISFGIVGAAKLRIRLLTAHFVYSVAIYIITLIGTVLFFFHYSPPWYSYVIAFSVLLIQATGVRHSRILICLLKSKNSECGNNAHISTIPVEINAPTTPVTAASAPNPSMMTPQDGQSFPMYPIPQMYPMHVQPGVAPQFYPFQPVQYPFEFHAPAAQQSETQTAQPQPTQSAPIGFYPVSYGQY